MKTVIISNLFPNNAQPTRGIFNKQQFEALRALGRDEIMLIAPLPWYYKRGIPPQEEIAGFQVFHPRYFMLPKLGRFLYGRFFYHCLLRSVRKIYPSFKFDVILATWAYPDGYGSYLLAKKIHKPLLIKVHGSDINLYTKSILRKRMITESLKNCNQVIAVSEWLKEQIVQLGVAQDKITLISNGINTDLFTPKDKGECRKKLNLPLEAKIILFVGNFASVKGLDHLLDAFVQIATHYVNCMLVLVGDGELKEHLRVKSIKLGLGDKVKFVERQPHEEIVKFMNAADIFCLPSLNEGCPNVVLEAIACGRPVVGSNVGGMPEIITSPDLGELVEPASPDALAEALTRALGREWDTQRIQQASFKYSWEASAQMLRAELEKATVYYRHVKRAGFKHFLKSLIVTCTPEKVVLWKKKNKTAKIALTFDDGPNRAFTPQILDILKARNVRASFFLVGKEVENNRPLTQRIIADGHCVGAHSYSHNGYIKMNSSERKREISLSLDVLYNNSGRMAKYFRPPNGIISLPEIMYCAGRGITTVLWNKDMHDYRVNSSQIFAKETRQMEVSGGDVILFHDDNQYTVSALPGFITRCKKSGYEFATIDELLKNRGLWC